MNVILIKMGLIFAIPTLVFLFAALFIELWNVLK